MGKNRIEETNEKAIAVIHMRHVPDLAVVRGKAVRGGQILEVFLEDLPAFFFFYRIRDFKKSQGWFQSWPEQVEG